MLIAFSWCGIIWCMNEATSLVVSRFVIMFLSMAQSIALRQSPNEPSASVPVWHRNSSVHVAPDLYASRP